MDKRIANIGDCLLEINPEIKFTYCNDDYETLVILSDHEKPTKEAIESAKVKAQKKIDDTYYQIQRSESYPSWQEQMDLLYHGGVDALKAELKKTKDKFPKPE